MLGSFSLDEKQLLACTNQEKDGHCVGPTKVVSGARKLLMNEDFCCFEQLASKIMSADRFCKLLTGGQSVMLAKVDVAQQ